MGYLIRYDYKSLIQVDNLSSIIGSDFSILSKVEEAAQTEVISYLTQKYDISKEFTNTSVWAYGVVRNAKDRVYLDANEYSSSSLYALNALTLKDGKVYRCTTAITSAEVWTPSHWSNIGNQYTIYYALTPQPEWDYYATYVTGNQVFYKNKTYTALTNNSGITPDSYPEYWGAGTTYSIAANILPSDASKWVQGDNRNSQLVNYMIDIVLYHIHSRIAPHNIPELRVKRYDDAIAWLKNCAKGDWITASLPLIQPKQGMRARWGSRLTKQNNNF
jgi:hypothetical protein